MEREGRAARGRGQWRGGVGRAIRKETAGRAAGRTCRDPPTETEKLRDREAGGVGRGGGGGRVQRETARDELRGPGRPGWEKLDPQPRGQPDPHPTPCPRTRRDTRARAHTRHSGGAARAPQPSEGRARLPRPPPAAGASRTRRRRSPWSPRRLRRCCRRAEPEPGAGGGGRGGPAPLRPPGPRRAPDAAAATGPPGPPEGGGRRPPGPRARPPTAEAGGPGPVRAGSREPGVPSPDPPHPGALRRLWAAPAGEGGVPGHPGGPIGSLASDPSLLGSLPRPLRAPSPSRSLCGDRELRGKIRRSDSIPALGLGVLRGVEWGRGVGQRGEGWDRQTLPASKYPRASSRQRVGDCFMGITPELNRNWKFSASPRPTETGDGA